MSSMDTHVGMALIGLLVTAAAIAAQAPEPKPQEVFRQVRLRVISLEKGKGILIDRGKRDELHVGDNVIFRPRAGGMQRGVVREVAERTSMVELNQPGTVIPTGTSGEVLVPNVRFRKQTPPDQTGPPQTGEGRPGGQPGDQPGGQPGDRPGDRPGGQPGDQPGKTRPGFENKDKDYRPGMPLLQGGRPIRPRERATSITGRVFMIGDLTHSDDGGGTFDNSFGRVGIDTTIANPVGYGGTLRFDGEANYRTELDNTTGANYVPRRLSYTLGGDRFSRDRFTFGRFLQHGMPEFQLLDGVEWGRRRENGDRYGASFGYLPEPDKDLETGKDAQIAFYYEWVSGDLEELTFTTAYQKTLHNGKSDRDLLVTKLRYLPANGWDLNGSMWLDFYNGRDDAETSDLEVTQAWLSASRVYKSGSGQDLTYRRTRYPETLRSELLVPPIAQQVADSHYDRLTYSAWYVQHDRDRLHGQLGVFQDQDDEGGNIEFGIEMTDFWVRSSTTDVTVFGTAANHETDAGLRVQHGRSFDGGRWDALYEVARHHYRSIADDRDDLYQHRLRYSRTFSSASNWHSTLYAEGRLWDEESSFSVGFYLQRRF